MSSADRIYYDERRRTVWQDGTEPTVIRAKSFAVFMALARAYPSPVSKDDLIRDVWGGAAVSDDSITQSVATIRRALGDKEHTLLQTIPGQGYRLMIPAGVEDPAPTPTPTPTPEEPSPPPAEKPARRPTALIVAGAVAVLGLGGLSAQFLLGRSPAPEMIQTQTDKPSVAVLEFDVLADQSGMQTFAKAMQSDLVVALSELDTVVVLAPTVLDDAEAGQTPLRAYAAHGAEFVIGGTIQQAGTGLRISGHLVDTSTSQIVWVRSWDAEQGDMAAVQTSVVSALAGELANPWTGQITGLGARLGGADANAASAPQDLVLEGARRFGEFHPLALAEAEQLFRKALEQDAQNADAWAGLSFVLGARLPLTSGEEASALRDARANAGRQAYHLGEGSGRSLLAGSWTAALRGNRRETLRRLTEAVEKLSSDADGLAMASVQAALTTDLYAEAVDWGERALALQEQPSGWYALGPAYGALFLGDHDRAEGYLRQVPDGYAPAMALLAALEHKSGRTQKSVETAARLRMLHNAFSVEGYLNAELIYPEDKQEILRNLLSETAIRMR